VPPVSEEVGEEEFKAFDAFSMNDEILLRVFEKGMLKSDPIGFCEIRMKQLCFNGGSERDYNIQLDG